MWQGSIGLYSSGSTDNIYCQCAIRHSLDSYASNITEQNIEFILVARADIMIQYPGIFSAIHTPTHSAGDTHTYKMYSTDDSAGSKIIRSNRRATGPMYWYTYEIAL